MATPNSIALDVIGEFEEASDDPGFVSRIEQRVNDALAEIAIATNFNSFKLRSTFNTVIGQASYSLPVGGIKISQLRYTDTSEPILHWTTQEAARRSYKLEEDGRARTWIEDGNLVSGLNVLYRFRLAPVPDAILEVEQEFYYHPSNVASASTLPFQDQYIVLVKDRVRAYLNECDQKYDAADRCQRRYESNLDRLVKHEKRDIAATTRLRQTDLNGIRQRPEAQFDPGHFQNP